VRTKQQLTEDIRHHRRAALVVNARSRRGQRLYQGVRARLLAAGVHLLADLPVSGDLEEALHRAIDSGADLVIAGGGDGTISTAGRMLADRKSVV